MHHVEIISSGSTRKKPETRKVLIVHRNPLESLAIRRAFELRIPRCEVYFCSNSHAAVEFLSNCGSGRGPDAMVVDLDTVGERGVDTLGKMRDRDPGAQGVVPMFVIHARRVETQTMVRLGATGHLRKPAIGGAFDVLADMTDRQWRASH